MNPISLLYHDVVSGDPDTSGFPGADADSYKLEANHFVEHLERIAELHLADVQLISKSGSNDTETSRRPIFLTFDDGGITADAPTSRLLERRNWRGHFFIVTAKVGQPGFLSTEQIRDLHDRGHHIGSHSHTHPTQLSKLTYSEMLHEWKESRGILTEILGQPPFSASVPGGFFSRQVACAAREAGYDVLFNSEPISQIRCIDGLTIIGRYGIKRNTPASAAQALARGDIIPRASQFVVWNVKKPAKNIGGPAWFTIRRWIFATVVPSRTRRDIPRP
jgi:peptidoglycan/xylan/chitin deacetylase (PgdA/CDA1 family)